MRTCLTRTGCRLTSSEGLVLHFELGRLPTFMRCLGTAGFCARAVLSGPSHHHKPLDTRTTCCYGGSSQTRPAHWQACLGRWIQVEQLINSASYLCAGGGSSPHSDLLSLACCAAGKAVTPMSEEAEGSLGPLVEEVYSGGEVAGIKIEGISIAGQVSPFPKTQCREALTQCTMSRRGLDKHLTIKAALSIM